MESLDDCQQNILSQEIKGAGHSADQTWNDTFKKLIQCQKEINALNNKLFTLCKNDKERNWLKSKRLLYFTRS